MKLICTAFFLALIIASCSKAIPDETMDGRGTFYCKVNGEDYLPDCQGFACRDVNASYSTFGDIIGIEALREKDGQFLDIYIYIQNVSKDYKVLIFDTLYPWLNNTVLITDRCGEYDLTDSLSFSLELTRVDLQSGVISGSFSGVIIDSASYQTCGIDTFILTDGVFDLPITF